MGDVWIRVFYGIMIVGMVFCFLLAKRHGKDIRSEANAFAFAFVKSGWKNVWASTAHTGRSSWSPTRMLF